jgi:hypothetical protein
MSRTARVILVLSLLPFLVSAQQALTGTITGTVTDPTEAAVPGAQVTARNTETGLERSASSGELGLYTLTLLPVGDYEVTAKKQGFADVKVGSVRVGVGQLITVELRMTVGAAATQVQVESGAAAVETTTRFQTSASTGAISLNSCCSRPASPRTCARATSASVASAARSTTCK